MIDLHTHSTASDGTLSPTELINKACSIGIEAMALTDHDTTSGLKEFTQAARSKNIEAINGIELAASWYGGSMHIVGLFIDPTNSTLQNMISKICEERNKRNQKIVSKLNEIGIDISWDEVAAESGHEATGRPHFAKIIIKKGHCKTFSEVFDKYLGTNKVAYVRRYLPLPNEVIATIHQAGGIAIWAHPLAMRTTSTSKFRYNVRKLKEFGLDAIEAYYPEHTIEQQQKIIAISNEQNIAISGGSDFHGTPMPHLELGIGRGSLNIPLKILNDLKQLKHNKIGIK